MAKSKVAVLYTKPESVFEDYHRLMNLAGYQQTLPKDRDTALKINISWHYFYPACSTTPWQLEGVIRAMLEDGELEPVPAVRFRRSWYTALKDFVVGGKEA